MTNDVAILDIVKQFAKDRGVQPERIVPGASLSELGVDSLHAIDLAFRLEEHFGINIPLERFRARTVGEAVTFVAGLVEQQSRS